MVQVLEGGFNVKDIFEVKTVSRPKLPKGYAAYESEERVMTAVHLYRKYVPGHARKKNVPPPSDLAEMVQEASGKSFKMSKDTTRSGTYM